MLAKSRRSNDDAEKEAVIWRALKRQVALRGRGRWRLPDDKRKDYRSDLEDIRTGNSTVAEIADAIAESLAFYAGCYLHLDAARAGQTVRMAGGAEHAIRQNPPGDHAEAAGFGSADLARVRAQHVARRADVRRFRREVLADQLLTLAEIAGWLDRQQAADGPRTIWDVARVPRIPENLHLYVEVPAEGPLRGYRRLVACDDRRGVGIEVGSETRLLSIVTADGAFHYAHTAEGGVLEKLRALAHRTAEDVGWFEAEAAAFVLTGESPSVPLIRDTVVLRSGGSERGMDRIVMDIDPRVSPRVVAQQFAMLRQMHLQRPRSSGRAVDAKYAAVLEF